MTGLLQAAGEEGSRAVTGRLELSVGAPGVLIERVRLLDGQAAMRERAHLPAKLAPGSSSLASRARCQRSSSSTTAGALPTERS